MSFQQGYWSYHYYQRFVSCLWMLLVLLTSFGIQQCQTFTTTKTTTQSTSPLLLFAVSNNNYNNRIQQQQQNQQTLCIKPQRWKYQKCTILTTQNNFRQQSTTLSSETLSKRITRHELRSGTALSFSRNNNNDENGGKYDSIVGKISTILTSDISRSFKFSIVMILAGAVLGPFLDSYHSAFGVLQYNTPITAQLWSISDIPALITSWWVPPLFGLAGFIIGWLYILLDSIFNDNNNNPNKATTTNDDITDPSPPIILVGIAVFTFQYWLSGVLYSSGIDRTTILNIMSLVAASGFVVLDRTITGFIVSTATAIGGPIIEYGLISYFAATSNLSGYHYTDLGETGFFPLWIIPVYFLGGPAVGNLGRGIWNLLSSTSVKQEYSSRQQEQSINNNKDNNNKLSPPGCTECNDTRIVPCPNCDGIGTYVAMGGRSVQCTSCRGRGYVICRACFSYYGDDPYDIESIREIVSKMPD